MVLVASAESMSMQAQLARVPSRLAVEGALVRTSMCAIQAPVTTPYAARDAPRCDANALMVKMSRRCLRGDSGIYKTKRLARRLVVEISSRVL